MEKSENKTPKSLSDIVKKSLGNLSPSDFSPANESDFESTIINKLENSLSGLPFFTVSQLKEYGHSTLRLSVSSKVRKFVNRAEITTCSVYFSSNHDVMIDCIVMPPHGTKQTVLVHHEISIFDLWINTAILEDSLADILSFALLRAANVDSKKCENFVRGKYEIQQ